MTIKTTNPIKDLIEAKKQERLYLQEMDRLYERIRQTKDSDELDFLILKQERLKEKIKLPNLKN